MPTFTIDAENNITAHAIIADARAIPSATIITSAGDLEVLASSRLVEVWNSLTGVHPVKKFTSRSIAARRIWEAIQPLAESLKEPAPKPKASKAAKQPKAPKTAKPAAEAKEGSKKDIVLRLIGRKGGATLTELMEATNWQKHSVRGFIAGALGTKLGLTIHSEKRDGERVYTLDAKHVA